MGLASTDRTTHVHHSRKLCRPRDHVSAILTAKVSGTRTPSSTHVGHCFSQPQKRSHPPHTTSCPLRTTGHWLSMALHDHNHRVCAQPMYCATITKRRPPPLDSTTKAHQQTQVPACFSRGNTWRHDDHSASKLQCAHPRRILEAHTAESPKIQLDTASLHGRTFETSKTHLTKRLEHNSTFHVRSFKEHGTCYTVRQSGLLGFCSDNHLVVPTIVAKRHCCVNMLKFSRLKKLHIRRPETPTCFTACDRLTVFGHSVHHVTFTTM